MMERDYLIPGHVAPFDRRVRRALITHFKLLLCMHIDAYEHGRARGAAKVSARLPYKLSKNCYILGLFATFSQYGGLFATFLSLWGAFLFP